MKILELQTFFKIVDHLQSCINFTIHSNKAATHLHLFYVIADEVVISSGFVLNSRSQVKRYATLKALLSDVYLLNPLFSACNILINSQKIVNSSEINSQVIFNRRSTDIKT